MGGSRALTCLRLATRATLKIRTALRAGELSRGVGLRGFESHPLAFRTNPVVWAKIPLPAPKPAADHRNASSASVPVPPIQQERTLQHASDLKKS